MITTMIPDKQFYHQRQLASQLLALAVIDLFPNTLIVKGESTKLGFYCDFFFEQPLPGGALDLIEMRLRTLVKEDLSIRYTSMMRGNAESYFLHHRQPLLAELAASHKTNIIEVVQIGQFTGICPASTLESTSEIGSVRLLHIETDETQRHSRVVGTAFSNPQELKQFIKRYDHYLKKKDHRYLGEELNLFSQSSELSDFEWFWHPKGLILRDLLSKWAEKVRKETDYEVVSTPAVIKKPPKKLLTDHQLTFEHEDEAYYFSESRLLQHLELLSAMNKTSELPRRLLEYGYGYKLQSPSDLWGLFSAHTAWTDQLTSLCSKKELQQELISCLHFIEQIIRIFGFKAYWVLVKSRRGSSREKDEKEAIAYLTESFELGSFQFPFNSEPIEEEGLTGPRLELQILDEMERVWPSGSVSIVVHGKKVQKIISDCKEEAILVSSSSWGSLDRMIAMLIEQYEGKLPMWLAPEQVRLLAIGKSAEKFAEDVYRTSLQNGIRIRRDSRDVKLGEKVHDARKECVPYVVIIGEQEIKKGTLTVQFIERPEKNEVLSLDDFIKRVLEESQV